MAETWTGVEQDYTLMVASSLTQKMLTEEHLKQSHVLFSASKDSSPCDVYSFQVMASNDVGDSEPSIKIERMLPSLPQNISTVSDSLSHSVSKTLEGLLVIIISFKVCYYSIHYTYTILHVHVHNDMIVIVVQNVQS